MTHCLLCCMYETKRCRPQCDDCYAIVSDSGSAGDIFSARRPVHQSMHVYVSDKQLHVHYSKFLRISPGLQNILDHLAIGLRFI